MAITRREFLIGSAGMGLAALGLVGCGGSDGGTTWTATADDSLDCLTMQVAGGNVVAMTGDGWAPRDGYVQLQLSGASIPGQQIESVAEKDGTLTVTLKTNDGIQTMDLLLTQWKLEGGDVDGISKVLVDYGNDDVREAQKSYD